MIQAATIEAIENAVKMFGVPKQEQSVKTDGVFDLAAYLTHYGIGFKIKGNGSKTIYALDHCVFDSGHVNNDAAVFQFVDGKLGYKCFHDSCQGKGWKEAREAISGSDSLRSFMPGGEQIKTETEREPDLVVCTMREVDDMVVKFADPIIDGLLERGDSLLVTGPGGLGKSLVTLAMSVAIAAGKTLFDRFQISEPHKVLLLQSENSLKATKARLKALMDTYRNRVDYLTYQDALSRIFTTLTPDNDPRLAGNILDDKFQKTLKEILVATQCQVVIFDPLISFHRQNENDNTKMREALDVLSHIAGPDVSVVATHHHSKSIEATGANKARGASAILDWARGILTLNKQNHESKNLIRVSHTKAGNFKPASPFLLMVDGPVVVAIEPDVIAPPSKVVEILYDMGGKADSKNTFIKAICEDLEVSRRTAFEAINKAVDFGFIRVEQDGSAYIYTVVKQ